MSGAPSSDPPVTSWQRDIHAVFGDMRIEQVGYVPDAGHTGLIELCQSDPAIEATVLTTEEEGIGLLAGAWLGGQRGALLMQSSGVGNCVNMLATAVTCRVPMLFVVTMRGEWQEFNPWQEPMGGASQDVLERMGTVVRRAEAAGEAGATVRAAADDAFGGDRQAAVLIAQRLIGAKQW